jgi:tellurite resistance protein
MTSVTTALRKISSTVDVSPAEPIHVPFPFGWFGVPLGLAGLGGAWFAAASVMGAPTWPDELLYALSAVFWIIFTGVYVARGIRRPRLLRADLIHPGAGPLAAYIPVVAILLSAHYGAYFPSVGPWATVGFVVILAVQIMQLVAHWLTGNLRLDAVHGGYFIPIVAGPFVASIGLTLVGFADVDSYAFGAALIFWLSFGTIILFRHVTDGPMPVATTPTSAAFLAAPANAAVAWIVAHPGPIDEPLRLLTGFLFVMVAVQLAMIGHYRKTPFSLSYWIFAFPVASTANYLVRWLARGHFAGANVSAWVVLAIATTFILGIGLASILFTIRGARPRPSKESRSAT